ncbi:MAG TPA: PaaI family thioesterase [Gemmataceae bacterium]|nr:PaaI family thioesterase [Gemmataceae bacterium]
MSMLEQGQRIIRGELPPPPIARLLGFKLKSIEPGHAVFEMPIDEHLHNPMGTLHGGINCDLADAAMGYAYASTLAETDSFTTVELKINFLRAVRKGVITADARVVKAGSTIGYIECDVKDDAGKLVAKAASTCMKLAKSRP